ncbi:hypothetical protein EES42_16840 [Streptomyces sp. ADI95-17]|nr:hypothetical protein EES42_16840 [Streptomyces sp. ADI95-17]
MWPLRGGPGTALGHHRRPLLQPRRALAPRHPAHQPDPAGLRRPDHRPGPLPGPHGCRTGRVRRSGRRRRAAARAPGGGQARSGAALLRPAAPLVPAPPGGAVGHLQHPAGPAPHGSARPGRPPARAHRPGGAARIAAHPLRDGRRRRLPMAAPGRRSPGGAAGPHGDRGRPGGGARGARRPQFRPGIRTPRPGNPVRERGPGARTAGGDASHRLRRLVHHPAAARPGGRLRRPSRGHRPCVGAAAGAVRRLHPLAAGAARGGRGAAVRILAPHTGRAARRGHPAGRPSAPGGRHLPRQHPQCPRPRGAARRADPAGPGDRQHVVHGGPGRRSHRTVPFRRGGGHPDRRPDRGPLGAVPRRPGGLLRQHPGAAHRSGRRPELPRAADPGPGGRPGGLGPPGPALRPAGGDPQPRALHRSAPALPGRSHPPGSRHPHPRTPGNHSRVGLHDTRHLQVRPDLLLPRTPHGRRPPGWTGHQGRVRHRPVRRRHRRGSHRPTGTAAGRRRRPTRNPRG